MGVPHHPRHRGVDGLADRIPVAKTRGGRGKGAQGAGGAARTGTQDASRNHPNLRLVQENSHGQWGVEADRAVHSRAFGGRFHSWRLPRVRLKA